MCCDEYKHVKQWWLRCHLYIYMHTYIHTHTHWLVAGFIQLYRRMGQIQRTNLAKMGTNQLFLLFNNSLHMTQYKKSTNICTVLLDCISLYGNSIRKNCVSPEKPSLCKPQFCVTCSQFSSLIMSQLQTIRLSFQIHKNRTDSGGT